MVTISLVLHHVDTNGFGTGLIDERHRNGIRAVEYIRRTIRCGRTLRVLVDQLIVEQLGRVLRIDLRCFVLENGVAVVLTDHVALLIHRAVDQLAGNQLVIKRDLLVGVAGRDVPAGLIRLVAGQTRRGHSRFLALLQFKHLIGVAGEGLTVEGRFHRHIHHVPVIIECDLLVSVGQMNVVFVPLGASQFAGRFRAVAPVRLLLADSHAIQRILLPRKSRDRLILYVVLIGDAGGVGIELALFARLVCTDTAHGDSGVQAAHRVIVRCDFEVAADALDGDLNISVVVCAVGTTDMDLLHRHLADAAIRIVAADAAAGVKRILSGDAVLFVLCQVDLNLLAAARHAVDVEAAALQLITCVRLVGLLVGQTVVGVGIIDLRHGIGVDLISNPILTEIDDLAGLFRRVFHGFGGMTVFGGVGHRERLSGLCGGHAGSAVVVRQNGAGRVVGIEGIFLVRFDRNAAGDLRSGLVHRAAQRQDIIRVLGCDGDSAGFITQVDLAGFGDVQIDTGNVGVDGAAGVGAARLVSESGLFKQQLVSDGFDSSILFEQQSNRVFFHSLLQRGIRRFIIGCRSSSLIGNLSVGVVASRCGNAVFSCGSQQVCEKLTGNISTVMIIFSSCWRYPVTICDCNKPSVFCSIFPLTGEVGCRPHIWGVIHKCCPK